MEGYLSDYQCNLLIKWSRRAGLNRQPADYESAALPLSYVGPWKRLGDRNKQAYENLSLEVKRFDGDGFGLA
jgi:hypothetical protein